MYIHLVRSEREINSVSKLFFLERILLGDLIVRSATDISSVLSPLIGDVVLDIKNRNMESRSCGQPTMTAIPRFANSRAIRDIISNIIT